MEREGKQAEHNNNEVIKSLPKKKRMQIGKCNTNKRDLYSDKNPDAGLLLYKKLQVLP